MKKKLLVILCLVAMLMLSACGGTDVPAVSTPEPTISTPTPTVQPTEEPIFEPEGETIATSEFSEPTEEPELTTEPDPGPECVDGIYLATMSAKNYVVTVDVYRIDPVTAEIGLFRTFSWRSIQGNRTYGIYSMSNPGYHIISYDHSKVAITMYDADLEESHVGWLDENGEFFDVTIALDWQYHGGFSEEKVNYKAEGFLPGSGELVFQGGKGYAYCYGVPVDDITPEAVTDYTQNTRLQAYTSQPILINRTDFFTDQISENLYLADVGYSKGYEGKWHAVEIYDATTGECTPFLPENTRCNYGGIISPDGTMVAFFSEERSSTHKEAGSDIYIVPLSGGEPQLLVEASEFITDDVLFAQLINWQ